MGEPGRARERRRSRRRRRAPTRTTRSPRPAPRSGCASGTSAPPAGRAPRARSRRPRAARASGGGAQRGSRRCRRCRRAAAPSASARRRAPRRTHHRGSRLRHAGARAARRRGRGRRRGPLPDPAQRGEMPARARSRGRAPAPRPPPGRPVGGVEPAEPAIERQRLERPVDRPHPRPRRRTTAQRMLRGGRQQPPVEQSAATRIRGSDPLYATVLICTTTGGLTPLRRGGHAAARSSSVARAVAKRVCGASAATAYASAIVSTSRRGGQDGGGEAEVVQAGALEGAGGRLAHRDAAERLGIGAAEADPPVAAVERGAEHSVRVLERAKAGVEQLRRHLRRVHPDQEGGPPGGLERGGQARRQPVSALRHDVDVARQPRPGSAFEHEHEPGRTARARSGRQRVAQRRAGELCRLFGGTGRRQARLDPPRERGSWR